MITLRCTAKAAKSLGLRLMRDAPSGTSPLGDWYVNLVPTAGGSLYLFMNEQSLLAVCVPVREPAVLNMFVARVGNILSMIGLPNERIEQEIDHFIEFRVAKTASPRILGVMSDVAYRCQLVFESAPRGSKISLSDLELDLANMPQVTLGSTPSSVAHELLSSTARFGAV